MGDDSLAMFVESLHRLVNDTKRPAWRPQGIATTIHDDHQAEYSSGDPRGRHVSLPSPWLVSAGTDQLIEQFLLYRRELLDWNTRMNLTAITKPEEVLIKHFLDSLSMLSVYDKPQTRLLDIGSGAGFPGLPLKIVRPRWRVTLLEATGKKATFLQHMIETLQLQEVVAVHGRAEELAHKEQYRAAFDVVTARAVASIPILLEYVAPFCRVGGQIILLKKGSLEEELASGKHAARVVGAVLKADVAVTLPGLTDGRRLLVWEQQKLCPAQYPRSGATIAKKPLN